MTTKTARSTRLEARISPEALALLKRAAEIEGRSVSDFVVGAASEAARKAISDTQMIHLSLADQEALARALLEPAEPNAALRRARDSHRRLIRSSR